MAQSSLTESYTCILRPGLRRASRAEFKTTGAVLTLCVALFPRAKRVKQQNNKLHILWTIVLSASCEGVLSAVEAL